MKEIIVVAAVIAIMVPSHAVAQRGGAGVGGGRGVGFSGRAGRPPARPGNGSDRHLNRLGNAVGRNGLGRSSECRDGGECNGIGSPYPYYGDYGYLPDYNEADYQSQANTNGVTRYQ